MVLLTHLDIPLLTGFLSPPQGFEPVTKSLRSLGKHPCYQLSYSSVGSESAPHFNIGPCGRGFELSRRQKKGAIGTCPYSPVSEWSPPTGRPRGGALTIKGAFYCGTPASAADPTYSDFWWTPGLGRPRYPLRDLPHFHGSPRTWDLGLKHQILTKWVPTELLAQLVPIS